MLKDFDHQRQTLIALGPERLADALLELAERHADVADYLGRLVASPQENVQRFKAKLAALKRRQRFIDWAESTAYAHELSDQLADLKAGVQEPKVGAELVAAFFQADRAIFEQCDDSNGSIGDVFRHEAKNLFVHYAAQCSDKSWLSGLVAKVSAQNDYGIRDVLIESAAEFLPKQSLRDLADRFERQAEQAADEYQRRHHLRLVEALARQLKDAPLFEKARLRSWPELSTAACLDIAEVYFEAGAAEVALDWLERISAAETFKADERDDLLMKIHEALGNRSAAIEAAWRKFRRSHSPHTLDTLLALIGEDQRDTVMAEETARILAAERLNYADALFLLQMGRVAEAERYLLERADQLNGDLYGLLLPMAETLEQAQRLLAASLIYRALIDSILRRAQSKYYHHGVRYLHKLETLAPAITDWERFGAHDDYFRNLQQAHARKSSFWSRYSA
jgi:hypothetical protein